MLFRPHAYQLQSARRMLDHPFMALLADPGLGKTAIMLMLIHELKRIGCLPPTLITATKQIATQVWPEEIEGWDQFNGISYSVIQGAHKERAYRKPADIYVTNNESLPWMEARGYIDKFAMLIIDESSKFKSWGSQRTKLIKKHLHHFQRRYLLTGSPTPLTLLDLFPQMYIVDRGETFGRYLNRFKFHFFQPVYGTNKWVPRYNAEKIIYEKAAPFCIRLDAKIHLRLPPLEVHDIRVSLPEAAKEDAKNAVLKIDLTSRINSSTDRMQARRLASGIDANGKVVHDAKLVALRKLLDDLKGRPALVFCYFRSEGDYLSAMLDAPIVRGGTSSKKSSELFALWNAGKLPVLILQPAAAGHGLNLQRGGTDIIWFSLTDNQDDYYQAIRRVWRQGVVGDKVTVHRLLAKASIDVAMARSLEDKTNTQQAFLDAMLALQEELRDVA